MSRKSASSSTLAIDPVADLLGGGRTVAYKVALAHAIGSVTAALWLSQLWFWSNEYRERAPQKDRWDGEWLRWSQEDQTAQTGMSRRECETARKRLQEIGLTEEERRGIPSRPWVRLNRATLYDLLLKYSTRNDSPLNTGEIRQCEPNGDESDGGNAQCTPADSASVDGENEQCATSDSADVDGENDQCTIGTGARSEITGYINPRPTTDHRAPEPVSAPALPAVGVLDKNSDGGKDGQSLISRLEQIGIDTNAATALIRDWGAKLVGEVVSSATNCQNIRAATTPPSYLNTICKRRADKAEKQTGEAERNITRAPASVATPAPPARKEPAPTPAPDHDATYAALSDSDRAALDEAAWARAMADAPAPIRARLEAASKSEELPSRMVRELLLIARNVLLAERAEAARQIDLDFG